MDYDERSILYQLAILNKILIVFFIFHVIKSILIIQLIDIPLFYILGFVSIVVLYKLFLFKIDCIETPACVCCAYNESIMHYLLKCARYSALRISSLSAAAQVCGDSWNLLSDSQKLKMFLFVTKKFPILSNNSLKNLNVFVKFYELESLLFVLVYLFYFISIFKYYVNSYVSPSMSLIALG
jgi:hypothetical protein